MSDDPIVAFLTARLDETEADARDASTRSPDWFAEDVAEPLWGEMPRDRAVIAGGKPIVTEDSDYSRGMVVDYIARHDPSRVLADVAAKRAILAMVRNPEDLTRDEYGEWHLPGLGGYGEAWIEVVLSLARAYADHPDFDPSWT